MTEHKTISIPLERLKVFEALMDKDTSGVGFSAMLAEAAQQYCLSEVTNLHTSPEVTKNYLHSLSPDDFQKHQRMVHKEAIYRLE